MFLDNLNITSSNGWQYALLVDGVRIDTSGIRSVFGNSCNFFGAQQKAVSLKGVVNAHFDGCETIQAGGTSGTLEITGLSTCNSQQIIWAGGSISDIQLDFCSAVIINVGRVNGVTNTANTSSCKIMAGSNTGGAQTNWISSAYI